jgi:hypothetical protein
MYSAAIVAVATADVIARFVFVGSVTTDEHSPWSEVVSQTGHVFVLTGNGPSATPIYWAIAGAVVLFALLAPALARARTPADVVTPWLIALLALFGLVTSLGFAPARSAAYQVSFPLYFYALLLCATVLLMLRMLADRPRAARVAAIAAGVVAATSLVASTRGAADLQRAMGPWSIETIKFEYDLTYGPLAERANLPSARQDAVNAHLAEVGLGEPRQAEPDDSLPYLYCRARDDSRIRIPETTAIYGGQDVLANLEFTCPHVYPPPAG